MTEPIPLTLAEVADFFGVSRDTPRQWRQRGLLPDPDERDADGRPMWHQETLIEWGIATGRWQPAGPVPAARTRRDYHGRP